MSAGNFILSTYRALYDPTQYHPIRIQPETLTLQINGTSQSVTNTAPTDPVTSPISAVVSGGARKLGLNARKVTVRFTANAPAGYDANGVTSLPWLDAATFIQIRKAQTGTYLGGDIVVVSVTPERAN